MRRNRTQLSLALGLFALLTISGTAQQAPPSAPRTGTRPAAEALAQLGQSAGVVILADATVLGRLPMPTVAATPATVEQQLAEMVRSLPAGTTWVKLYAPTPANGRWYADAVADYARAQARLLGTPIGRPTPAGQVELLGRQLPADKANEHIAALNLKLVYLVTNPQAHNASDVAANWTRLTSDQREAYARQQAQRLLSLDPASRLEALRQLMRREPTPQDMVLRMVAEQIPIEERIQLKQSVAAEAEAKGGK